MNPISEKIPAVLIIDDEKENRIRLEGLLLVLGFKTYAAEDSKEGIKIFESHKKDIDLVFLDMLLPETDSNETLKTLKNLKQEIKVLCMSDNAGKIEKRMQEMSDIGFVKKPVSVEQLVQRLNDIV